jgi:hypothetical protein
MRTKTYSDDSRIYQYIQKAALRLLTLLFVQRLWRKLSFFFISLIACTGVVILLTAGSAHQVENLV